MVFKGALSNSTIDFGADSDTLHLSVAASTSTILGGSGADTLVFTSGAESDYQLCFRWWRRRLPRLLIVVKSAGSIAGGGGNDTMVFNSSVGGAAVSLDSGMDSVSFVTLVSGATMFGGGGTQTVQFSICCRSSNLRKLRYWFHQPWCW